MQIKFYLLQTVQVEEYFRSASSLNTPVGFSGTKRSGCGGKMLRCCRFSSLNGYRYVFPIDVINVSVDRDVSLHGLCLFGSEDCSFSLDLEIQETISKSVLASKRDQFSSELLRSSLGNYCGFEVLLDIPVGFKKNNIYCIKAKIAGPCSVMASWVLARFHVQVYHLHFLTVAIQKVHRV